MNLGSRFFTYKVHKRDQKYSWYVGRCVGFYYLISLTYHWINDFFYDRTKHGLSIGHLILLSAETVTYSICHEGETGILHFLIGSLKIDVERVHIDPLSFFKI